MTCISTELKASGIKLLNRMICEEWQIIDPSSLSGCSWGNTCAHAQYARPPTVTVAVVHSCGTRVVWHIAWHAGHLIKLFPNTHPEVRGQVVSIATCQLHNLLPTHLVALSGHLYSTKLILKGKFRGLDAMHPKKKTGQFICAAHCVFACFGHLGWNV